jgi:hypothetical protein
MAPKYLQIVGFDFMVKLNYESEAELKYSAKDTPKII